MKPEGQTDQITEGDPDQNTLRDLNFFLRAVISL